MSPEAERLRERIQEACNDAVEVIDEGYYESHHIARCHDPQEIARAIVKELGITEDDVRMLEVLAEAANTRADNYEKTGHWAVWAERFKTKVATFLEVSRDAE